MVQAAIDEALVRGSSLTPPEFTRMYLARRLRPGSWAGRLGTLATPFQRDPATAAWAVKRIRGDRPIWHWPVVADVLLGAALALPSCEELLEELRELANEPGPGAALAPLVLLALGEPNLPDVAAVRQALATSSLPDAEEVLSSLAAASLQIRSLLPDLLPEEGDRWNTLRAALGDGADVAAALVSQPEWRFPEPLVRARCRTEPDFPDPFAVAAIALGGESGYRLLRRLDPAPEPLRERLAGEVGAADDPWVVAGCLHALCGVAPEPVVERAADLVASDQWVVRKNALALLLSMGETGRILPARAVELTADEAEAVRAAAAWVAADVCAADPGPAAAALLEALDRPVESLVYLLGTVLTAPEHAYLALESLVARAGP